MECACAIAFLSPFLTGACCFKETMKSQVVEESGDERVAEESVAVDDLSRGQIVLARHPSDDMWYQSEVVSIRDGVVSVRIDRLGETIELPTFRIKLFPATSTISDLLSASAPANDKRISMRERVHKVRCGFSRWVHARVIESTGCKPDR